MFGKKEIEIKYNGSNIIIISSGNYKIFYGKIDELVGLDYEVLGFDNTTATCILKSPQQKTGNMVEMNIGKSIRKALIDKDMTQTQLAEELGISRSSMSQLCSRDFCNKSTLDALCESSGMSASELIALGE